jgi:putative transposase
VIVNMDVARTASETQEAFWKMVDDFARQQVTGFLEEALLIVQRQQVGADWNQRSAQRLGLRNGFYRRRLLTPHGPLRVKVPRCRTGGVDCSLMFDRYQRRITDVNRLLRHAYLVGVSTRDTARLAEQIFGASVSHQTVSTLMRWLDAQLAAWRRRPIEPAYPVVYIDGMHVDVLGGDRMVMVVMGMRADGGKEVLDFCVSRGESCTHLLWSLRRRGLEEVQMFVSDDSGGIRAALATVYPEVPWQSCSVHLLWWLRDQLGPAAFRRRMVAEAARIFRCSSRSVARQVAEAWATRWRPIAGQVVDRFLEKLPDSLMFYELPKAWWKRSRTNNPLERLLRDLRSRLRLMGCFHDEPAVERAVFGQLLRRKLLIQLTQRC